MKLLWNKLVKLLIEDWLLIAAALLMALAAFFWWHHTIKEKRTLVPLKLQLKAPDGWALDGRKEHIEKVELTIDCTENRKKVLDWRIEKLNSTGEITYQFPPAGGGKVRHLSRELQISDLKLPEELKDAEISHKTVVQADIFKLEVRRYRLCPAGQPTDAEYRLEVPVTGRPAPGYRIERVTFQPEFVEADGAAEDFAAAKVLKLSDEIKLNEGHINFNCVLMSSKTQESGKVQLKWPAGGVTAAVVLVPETAAPDKK